MLKPRFSVTLRVRQQLDERWEYSCIVGGLCEAGVTADRFVVEDPNTTEPLYELSQDGFARLAELWYQWMGPVQGTLQAPQSGGRAGTER